MPELQLDLRVSQKDSGVASDRLNSGGELLYVTPGVNVRVSPRVRVYGLVSVPVYERVVGYQLTAKWTATTGVRFAF